MSGLQTRERTLRFDDNDRRRLVLASALTIVALPAVWLANQDDREPGTRPSVAAVGLAADVGDAAGDAGATEPVDPMGSVDARYLTGTPLPPPPQHVSIAIGSSADSMVASATAIYRRAVGSVDTCQFGGVAPGTLIRVVHVDNGRSVQCKAAPPAPDAPPDELVMHPDRFVEIADLTSAPIPVEIRQ